MDSEPREVDVSFLVRRVSPLYEKDHPAYELLHGERSLTPDLEAAKDWAKKQFLLPLEIWGGGGTNVLLEARHRIILRRPGSYVRHLMHLKQRFDIRHSRRAEGGDIDIMSLRRYVYWVREDPVIQLAVGSSSTRTIKTTAGLSIADARELNASIGAEMGLGNLGKVKHDTSVKWLQTLTATAQREVSQEILLEGPGSSDYYRRFAIWRRRWIVELSVLNLHKGRLYWHELSRIDYGAVDAPITTTSIDLPAKA